MALTVAAVSVLGCSTDDNGGGGGTQPDEVRVKKITQIAYFDGDSDTSVSNFTYVGTILTSFGSPERRTDLTYVSGKISEAKYYVNNVLDNTHTFHYNGDKLADVTSTEGERTVFTYAGNRVSQIRAQYFDEDVWVTSDTRSFQYSGDNVSQMSVLSDLGGGFTNDYRLTYVVDQKNNPLRDMVPEIRQLLTMEGILPMSANNAVSAQSFSPASSTTPNAAYTYEIVYNSDNFATSIKKKTAEGELITETLIEYY